MWGKILSIWVFHWLFRLTYQIFALKVVILHLYKNPYQDVKMIIQYKTLTPIMVSWALPIVTPVHKDRTKSSVQWSSNQTKERKRHNNDRQNMKENLCQNYKKYFACISSLKFYERKCLYYAFYLCLIYHN